MIKIYRMSIIKVIVGYMILNEFLLVLFNTSIYMKLFAIVSLLISGFFLVFLAYKNFYTLKRIHLYFKLLLLLLLIWSLLIIIRSIDMNISNLTTLFFHNQVGMWAWLTPLAIFIGLSITNWLKLFSFLWKFILLGTFFVFLGTVLEINLSVAAFLSSWPIFLLTHKYHSKKVLYILFISILIFVIYRYFVMGSRSSVITLFLIFLFLIFDHLKNSYMTNRKIFISWALLFFGLFITLQMNSLYKEFNNNKDLSVDSRSFLFNEIFTDMTENELLIGRGALGKYYSPYFDKLKELDIEGGDAADRSISETGYLQLILKGGYIMLGLYLFILIPAAYLGIFKSNNMISRMSGYIILHYIIMMILIYPPGYKLSFIILWIAVGASISPNIRALRDADIVKIKNIHDG